MNMYEMQTHIKKRIDEIRNNAENVFDRKFDEIDVKFDLNGRAAGCYSRRGFQFRGECTVNNRWINFNMRMAVENQNNFDQTIVHEYAHYVVDIMFNGNYRPHGTKWQWVMQKLGAPSNRCHNYKIPAVDLLRTRRNIYTCSCRAFFFTLRKHNSAGRGSSYSCKECGQKLSFVMSALNTKDIIKYRDNFVPEKRAIPMPKPAPLHEIFPPAIPVPKPHLIAPRPPAPKMPATHLIPETCETFGVNEISAITGFDGKKIRRVLRKHKQLLAHVHGKKYIFPASMQSRIIALF